MVDVGAKPATQREAVARGEVQVGPEALTAIRRGAGKKGDVLAVAQLAAIMGAKRTADLIPLCHTIELTGVDVRLTVVDDGGGGRVLIEASVRTTGRTGAEMEALTAVSVGALTVYDMCKAIDRGLVIGPVRLVKKSGGKSGEWRREGESEWPLSE
ncbi:MAG: cyclic pyranopterin monophosphate synthase MoaC [Bacillota bacterium]